MKRIDRLAPGDWKRLRRLRLAALEDAPDAFGSTLEHAEALGEADWRRQIETLATFVAVNDGVDVGLARGAADEADAANAFLLSMWVAPDARGRGVGERLVRAVAEWALASSCATLSLDVVDDNTHAVGLYARMGFEATDRTGSLPSPREHITEHRRVLALPNRSA